MYVVFWKFDNKIFFLNHIGQLDGSNLLPASSEKCVKQVLHQMLHLKSLWQDVLPVGIKSMP